MLTYRAPWRFALTGASCISRVPDAGLAKLLREEVGAEAGEVVVPDAVLVSACVCFGERFATRGIPELGSGHPVMVVSEFVKEDMEELEGARLAFAPLDQSVFAVAVLDLHADAVEDVLMV